MKSGFADQFDICVRQRFVDRRVELLARGKAPVRERLGGNAGRRGDLQAFGRLDVRKNQSDRGRKLRIAACFDQRGKIAAAPGNQNGGADLLRQSFSTPL